MGSGQTKTIEYQENCVNNNYKKINDVLNTPNNRNTNYIYNNAPVKGKLRQIYNNSDELYENRASYINKESLFDVKRKLNF